MAFDALPDFDLVAQTDAVIGEFDLPLTKNNLYAIAEEVERRLRLYPFGVVRTGLILREIQRRALETSR